MVAAKTGCGTGTPSVGFNPCKGFGVVAAKPATAPVACFAIPESFNPCKGFGVVAALSKGTALGLVSRFNPCKGFGVVAADVYSVTCLEDVINQFQSL